jgi:DNA-binding LacI/PurR family transcriptional regulator
MNTIKMTYNSKAIRISDRILADIREGDYKPGVSMPAEDRLAAKYMVSRPTVRRAIEILVRGQQLVKLPQRGVMVAPGERAAKKQIAQIAFISAALDAEAATYAKGMNDQVDHERFTLAIYSTHANLAKYRQVLENVVEMHPAGIVLTTMPEELVSIEAEALRHSRIPVVTIGHAEIPGLSCDRIDESGTENALKVARSIIRHGYRDIAYLGASPRRANEETIHALRTELGPAGIALPEDKIFIVDSPHGYASPPDPYADARAFMAELLKKGFRCNVLIAGHDYPAVGALQSILKAGIQVPREMKIISAMRCGVEAVTPMKLTTVDFNEEQEGRVAIKQLVRRIDGYTGPIEVHHVPVELIEGETA